MESRTGIPNKGLTHAGVFHVDDVFATALLRMLNPSIEVVRQNAVPEGFAGIVYDVGGGEFDHHRGEARARDNGVPFSSFGLLWNRFGTMLLQEEDAESLDKDLVQPIDLADNTGEGNPLSLCVSDFNPLHMASFPEFDVAFWKAVDWAQDVLERRIASLRARREQYDYVCGLAREGDGRVLVLDHMVRWKQALVGSGYVYVVYPSLRGGFDVQCVPQRLGDGSMVRPFPKAWRGKSPEELRELTGVSDVTFCHAAGFLCAVDSLDGALSLAKRAMVGTSHKPDFDREDMQMCSNSPEAKLNAMVDRIARAEFESYKELRRTRDKPVVYESMEDQPLDLQRSNYAQAKHIPAKVAALGYALAKKEDCDPTLVAAELTDEQVEVLARMEHDRFVEEGAVAGWTLDATAEGSDPQKKTSPFLVPYDDLDYDVQEYDRDAARQMLPLLDQAGLAVVRQQ